MQDKPLTSVPTTKAPILLLIISTMIMLSAAFNLMGLLRLLFSMGHMFSNGISRSALGILIMVIVSFAIQILLMLVAFGLRHLKKWALHTYIGVSALGIVMSLYGNNQISFVMWAAIATQIITLIYLWSIKKQFVV